MLLQKPNKQPGAPRTSNEPKASFFPETVGIPHELEEAKTNCDMLKKLNLIPDLQIEKKIAARHISPIPMSRRRDKAF
mgnify:CR=1 FL=1